MELCLKYSTPPTSLPDRAGPGRPRSDPKGPGQLKVALAPGPIGQVRSGPRAEVLRPGPWTVYWYMAHSQLVVRNPHAIFFILVPRSD